MQQYDASTQSGKRVLLNILVFIFGTVILLLAIKFLLKV